MGKADVAAASRAWSTLLIAREHVMRRAEHALAEAGLPSLAWYDVLWALEQAPGGRLRMFELAEKLVVARYNLTRIADRLVRAGLIERDSCVSDGRGAFCVLTASGRRMRARMWPTYRSVLEALVAAHIKPSELVTIEESLSRVAHAASVQGKTHASEPS
jgi:DNA-binding MarR family transcriptional regulator